jgi:ribosomal protein S18 acetylase RimI-like enzyme
MAKQKAINAQSRFSSSRVAHTMPVRPARAADLDAINRIHHACFQTNHKPLLPAGAKEWWNPSGEKLDTVPAFVVDGGVGVGVVGFVYIALPETAYEADYGQGGPVVDDIYVLPARQGEGLGKKLLRAAEKYVAQCGYSRVSLACLEVNDASRRFYESAGWSLEQPSGTITGGDDQPYVIFSKPVEPLAAGTPEHAPAAGMMELTDAQIAEFVEKGFVVVPDCIPKDLCKSWTDQSWERIGMSPDDPDGWQDLVGVPGANSEPMSKCAPKAWRAMCDLLGGPQKVASEPSFGDGFALNLGKPGMEWHAPAANFPGAGWHKDGWMFRHYLDSPEQGLLMLVHWNDVNPRSGGTFIAPDSVDVVAKFFAGQPQGLHPHAHEPLIQQCSEFLDTGELYTKAGDIIMCHPFMLHTRSNNPSGVPRYLSNGNVRLMKPVSAHQPYKTQDRFCFLLLITC